MASLRRWAGDGRAGYFFFCPGCDDRHMVTTEGAYAWGFNGNLERPTFTPSILVRWPANSKATEEFKEWLTERRCHSFVTEGQIRFLGDSTHALAGKTVPLPQFPDNLKD